MLQLLVTVSLFFNLTLAVPEPPKFKLPPAPNYDYGIDYTYDRNAWKEN